MFGYRNLGFGGGVLDPWADATNNALLLNCSNLTTAQMAANTPAPTAEITFSRGALKLATHITGGSNLYSHYNNTGGTGATNAIASGFHSHLAPSGGSSGGQTPQHKNFTLYNGTASPEGVWYTLDVGVNPTFRITRFTTYIKWNSGGMIYSFYGTNTLPVNGGSGNTGQTFPATAMTQLWTQTNPSGTFDTGVFVGGTYRYYIWRLDPTSGSYDHEPRDMNIYGSYYVA